MSHLDSMQHIFIKAEGVHGTLNTLAHDACTSISPDGKQIFIYKNDANDKYSRGGNLFVSKVLNGRWKTPEPLGKPINTSYWEGGATISSDGKTLYFVSDMTGGKGATDIYRSKYVDNAWTSPENVGGVINTEGK